MILCNVLRVSLPFITLRRASECQVVSVGRFGNGWRIKKKENFHFFSRCLYTHFALSVEDVVILSQNFYDGRMVGWLFDGFSLGYTSLFDGVGYTS